MRLTIFRQGVILVSLPLLFQLGLIALAIDLERRQSHAADRVAHAKEVRAVAQNVFTSLVDAETGVRGFLLTSDPQFIEPHTQAGARLPHQLALLVSLLDRSEQLEQARLIARQAAELFELLSSKLAIVQTKNRDAAALRDKTREGKRRMDRLRAELAGFLDEQRRLEDLDQQALARQRRLFRGFLIGGAAA